MQPITNLQGLRVGRLLVQQKEGAHWLCRCDCGTEKAVNASRLRSGHTRSCGCLRRDGAQALGRANAKTSGSAAARAVFARYKFDAKRRGLIFQLSFDECAPLFAGNCAYCNVPPATTFDAPQYNGPFTYNGIDRIDNAVGYVIGNCVSCCPRCNETKRNRTLADFKDWIRRVYKTCCEGGV